MKDIISKNKISLSCSRFYINDSVTITSDKKVIVEKYNSFFINVGPNLACWNEFGKENSAKFPIANRIYDQKYRQHESITSQPI